MIILDGRKPAQALLGLLAKQVLGLPAKAPRPCVAFVLVGKDGASATYVARKKTVAAEVGFESRIYELPETVTQIALIALVEILNNDPAVHGILVQTPLPKHLDAVAVFNSVSAVKDVDGFNTSNLGRLCQGDLTGFVPCTPAGIADLCRYYAVATQGQHVVIVGRSLTVGKPAALLFLQKTWNATITVCHSQTHDLQAITRLADVLIVATGSPAWIGADHIREGVVVIDVGINRVTDTKDARGYRLVGDVDFDAVAPKASAITPVPGGVGPLTVAWLMHNTFKAYNTQEI